MEEPAFFEFLLNLVEHDVGVGFDVARDMGALACDEQQIAVRNGARKQRRLLGFLAIM